MRVWMTFWIWRWTQPGERRFPWRRSQRWNTGIRRWPLFEWTASIRLRWRPAPRRKPDLRRRRRQMPRWSRWCFQEASPGQPAWWMIWWLMSLRQLSRPFLWRFSWFFLWWPCSLSRRGFRWWWWWAFLSLWSVPSDCCMWQDLPWVWYRWWVCWC